MAMTISGSSGVTYPDGTSQASGQQACKAWVNFNGTGTVAIRAAYNVTSITDNGNGDYTLNFTTAFSDINYSVTGSGSGVTTGFSVFTANRNGSNGALVDPTTSAVRVNTCNNAQTASDVTYVYVAIFR